MSGAQRSLAPDRQALSDQILAIVRQAAPLPVSTTDVGRQLGKTHYWYNTCGHPDICRDQSHWRSPGPRYRSNSEFVPLLRRLERLGHVDRLVLARDLTAHGGHFWRYLGGDQEGGDWPPADTTSRP